MTPAALQTGMVSITFRNLSPQQILDLVQQAGQQGVEWGGDVHVPHGDVAQAERVGRMTREAGLAVAAYGSYYRAGEREKNPEPAAVLDSAEALGAPTIRIWAGKQASAAASAEYRARVLSDVEALCAGAAERGLRVAFEYHGQTLTDSIPAAVSLLEALPLENLDTLWQPPNGQSLAYCLTSLRSVMDRVSNVHVFHWGKGWGDRYALADGADRWIPYFQTIATLPGSRWALMEFVKGDDPAQYLEDAAVLRQWLDSLRGPTENKG